LFEQRLMLIYNCEHGEENMTPATDMLIQEMARAIVREVNPRKVILFGSYGKGNPGRDSDVDLLIIQDKPFGKDRSRFREISKVRRVLSQFRVPKDILVYSSDEVAKWENSMNHILAHCLREGRVLYERH
jgi:uncharacterized protein